MKRIMLAIIAAVILAALCAPLAWAHFQSGDSVSSEYMTYDDNSKYAMGALHQAGQWDSLNCKWRYGTDSCPGVDIDSVSSGETVEVNDYSSCSSGVIGTYRTSGSPDRISLNTCLMDRKSGGIKDGVILHEFGHALGFKHPPDTAYYRNHSIMYSCTPCSGATRVKPDHDYPDYYKWWISPGGGS